MNRLGYVPVEIENEHACTGCQNCMIYCPDFAIAVEKDSDKSTANKEAVRVSAN
jgi:Pyruvate/2-oxoacid:ferredoxin oxidoreductase delta subunit